MRIAIIGASTDRNKFSNKAVRAYFQKGWEVFPVNPKYEKIEGLTCYPTLLGIPGDVDVVSFYVPPFVGEEIAKELPKKNVQKVYLNPGAESDDLLEILQELEIKTLLACSIQALGVDPKDL